MARKRPWYETFYEGDYTRYFLASRAHMVTPQRCDDEVDFAQRVLDLAPGDRVLDLCCGPGRHAVRLAQRGLQVVGLDLSAAHLKLAREAARDAAVSVAWVRADMRRIPARFRGRFDAVISMFTSLGYFEDDDEEARVIRGIAGALRPGGRLLIDTINREWVLRNYQPRDWLEHDGCLLLTERRFDAVCGINHETLTIVLPDGSRRRHELAVRVFALSELVDLLQHNGLRFVAAYGNERGDAYGSDRPRTMVVARRPGGRGQRAPESETEA